MQEFLHAFVFFMLAVEYVSAQANYAQKRRFTNESSFPII